MTTEITETEIDPRIVEELQALRDHVKELDREASQVRAIALQAQSDAAGVYAMFGRPQRTASLTRTVAAVAGMTGIAIGCWLVAPALSWIVMGSILLGIVVAGSALQKRGNDV